MINTHGIAIDERAFQFGKSVVIFARAFWKTAEGRIIAQQLVRSATSIGANIAEGQDASSKRQFIQYLQIALRSSRETRFWLRLAFELDYSRDTRLSVLQKEIGEIIGILVASIIKLKSTERR